MIPTPSCGGIVSADGKIEISGDNGAGQGWLSKKQPTSHGTPTRSLREDRQKLNGHRGAVLWFTGLSGCGKGTIANAVDQLLYERGIDTSCARW
jgi:hypothetical protein